MAYATLDDVYAELGAQAFVSAPRVIGAPPSSLASDFDQATGAIRVPGNGWTESDIVYAHAAMGGSLPGGMALLTPYYVLPTALGDVIKLAASEGGSALTYTSAGAAWGLIIDPVRRILFHLEDTAATLDNDLTAHKTPLKVDPITGLYPRVVVGVNARMAARKAVTSLQIDTPQFRVPLDRLFASEARDDAARAEWRAGREVYPQPTDQTTSADNGPRANGRTSAGWKRAVL